MHFGLSESQQILKDTAREILRRRVSDRGSAPPDGNGHRLRRRLWTKLAEQGFTGIIFPEEYGGVGLGIVELILLLEEAGCALLPGPFFSTVRWPAR